MLLLPLVRATTACYLPDPDPDAPPIRIEGGCTDPDLIKLVTRFENGEEGDLVSTQACSLFGVETPRGVLPAEPRGRLQRIFKASGCQDRVLWWT